MKANTRSPGDPWTHPYRGMTLHMGGDGRIWWHPYRGQGRLYLEEVDPDLVAALKQIKPTGAQFRVTEQTDVLARVEDESEGSYDPVWVGRFGTPSTLVVEAKAEKPLPKQDRTVDLQPSGLSPGDLWPSIYDGTRFSMNGRDTVWWSDPESKYRFFVQGGIPQSILDEISFIKPRGGSFRVTPWGDVITLVKTVPRPKQLAEQFGTLPIPVRQIIRIRKERGVEYLPVYVGSFDVDEIDFRRPTRLDEDLAAEQDEEIRSWIESLGPNASSAPSNDSLPRTDGDVPEVSEYDDDPDEWAEEILENEELDDDEFYEDGEW